MYDGSVPRRPRFIPFAPPLVEEADVRAAAAAWRSGWITTGPRTAEFERAVARYVGARHAVAVASCTEALHLALRALGVGPGHEVLVPALTFVATAHAVRYVGAMPVFCDVDSETLCLDPDDMARRVSRRTKAVIPVHYGGVPCEMREILRIARRRGLAVVEDAAHALGSAYRGRRIGGLASQATCFSFYATKNLTTAEGGMVTTPDRRLAARVKTLSMYGIGDARRIYEKRFSATGSWDYAVTELGYKANMPDALAAVGLAQLRRLDRMNRERGRRAALYLEAIRSTGAMTTLAPAHVRSNAHLFPLLLPPWIDRDFFIAHLGAAGIGTSVLYRPLPLQPYYRDLCGHRPGDFPYAEDAFARLVCLPVSPAIPLADVRRAAREVRAALLS